MSSLQRYLNRKYKKGRGKADGMLASATPGAATGTSSRMSATESITTAPGEALGSLNDPRSSIIQNTADDFHSIGIESGSFDIPETVNPNTPSADPDPPHPTAGPLSAAGHTYSPFAGHAQVDTSDAVTHNERIKAENAGRRDVIAKPKLVVEEWNRFYEAMLSHDVDEDLLEQAKQFATLTVPGHRPDRTLAISKMTYEDLVAIFPFKSDDVYSWELKDHERNVAIPNCVEHNIGVYKYVLGDLPINGPKSQSFIDVIMYHCWYDEKCRLQGPPPQAGVKCQASQSSQASGSSVASLRVQQETTLSMQVDHGGENVWLTGKADYSLWYGLYGQMECNLAIVEAKRVGLQSQGVIQCQAYMSIIHKARKRVGKPDTVYGIASDGLTFEFLRMRTNKLTGETVVTSHAAKWNPEVSEKRHVVALLRRIYGEAVALPPTRSGSVKRGESVAKRQKVKVATKERGGIDTDQY